MLLCGFTKIPLVPLLCITLGFDWELSRCLRRFLYQERVYINDKAVNHLVDPPALDHDAVLIEAVKHADLQVNAGLDHPHWDADCHSSHLNRYLFVPTCPSSQMVYIK